MLASRIVLAEPRRLPVRIWRMNWGTSIPVGQALMQGASWQNRQREPSSNACEGVKGGLMSAKFLSSCSSGSLGDSSNIDYLGLPCDVWSTLSKRER